MGFCIRLGARRLTYRILSRLPFLSFPKFLPSTGIDLKPEDGYFAEAGEKGRRVSLEPMNHSGLAQHPQALEGKQTNFVGRNHFCSLSGP